jgi:SAM-dependent methyltransferase
VQTQVPARTEFDREQYANIYPAGIESLYWHRARNRIVTRKLCARLSAGDVVLDLGCGAGILVAHLRSAGIECEGVDLGRPTTVVATAAPHLHLGCDAFSLPAAYRGRVSALLLMDVIEHLPDPPEFLGRCAKNFPNVRCIFLTVPARMEIWSNYDEYNGHFRRYTLESLRALAAPFGFKLDEAGYFFHSLYWAARVHGKLGKMRATTLRAPRARLLHGVIGRILDWEERLIPQTVPGASLYAAYSRRLWD